MHILNYKNQNILCFPKCGSTNIIKYCMDIPEFINHHHSYTSNHCSKYEKIHNCGGNEFKLLKNRPIIIIWKYPHERIISFFNSNYNGNLSFTMYVEEILKDINRIKVIKHHIQLIYKKLKNKGLENNKNLKFIHLSKLNEFWKKRFKVDISKHNVMAKSRPNNGKYNEDLIKKIKLSKYFKEDYDYLPKSFKSSNGFLI